MVNLNRKRERARILFVEDEEDTKRLAALTLTEYALAYASDGFAREWLSVFLEEVRGVYTPATASGD